VNLFARFFCAIHFFIYLCGMESTYKSGRAIKDKDVNFIKKYYKSNFIEVNGKTNGRYDRYELLNVATIKIKSIRKYENYYYNDKFAYEVDIEFDIKNSPIVFTRGEYYFKYLTTKRVRSLNDYYRYDIKEIVMNELKYFGISHELITISKIKYIYQ
jgi:hypothetical protein